MLPGKFGRNANLSSAYISGSLLYELAYRNRCLCNRNLPSSLLYCPLLKGKASKAGSTHVPPSKAGEPRQVSVE